MKKNNVTEREKRDQLRVFLVNIGILKKGMKIDEISWGVDGEYPVKKGEKRMLFIGINKQ
jgi:hypothetical protein